MSVYYNIKKPNLTGTKVLFKVNEQSFVPVLDKQSDYQVGIKRFKIPTSNIDFFRLYPKRYVLGVKFASDGNQSQDNLFKYMVDDVFSAYNAFNDNVDISFDNSLYNVILSNEHFCSILTRTFYNCLENKIDETNQNFTPSIANEANIGKSIMTCDTFNGTHTITNNFAIIPFVNKTAPLAGNPDGNGGLSRRLYAFNYKVNSMSLFDGFDVDLSELMFVCRVLTTDKDGNSSVYTVTILDGICYALR